MRWQRGRAIVLPLALAAGGLAGCGPAERPETGFVELEEAAPRPVMIIKRDSSMTPEGYRVAELHVLLMPGTGEAAARATLQHLIDSVAAADTLAAAVRITGFVMGSVDPERGTADDLPAIRATWGPADSAGFTGARRKSRYLTNYLLIRPIESKGGDGRTP